VNSCLPAKIHSFSRNVLKLYLDGHLPTSEFRRWFHMPNSEYLPLSDCIAQIVDSSYVPEARLPESFWKGYRTKI
jgi:hypothetical protein